MTLFDTFGDSRATMATLPRAAVLCGAVAVPDRWRRAMGGHLAVAIFGDPDKLEDGQCRHGLFRVGRL